MSPSLARGSTLFVSLVAIILVATGAEVWLIWQARDSTDQIVVAVGIIVAIVFGAWLFWLRLRKQVSESESMQNQVFRDLADELPQFLWTQTPDGKVEWINVAFETYTGLTAQGASDPATVARITHPDDLENVFAAFAECLRESRICETEYRIKHLDAGEDAYRWFLAFNVPVRNQKGEIESWVGTAIDMHDKHLAEAARTQEFRTLAESIPQIVWTSTADGHLDYYSQRWFDYIGVPETQTADPSWEAFLHPDDVAESIQAWSQACRSGEPYEMEYRFRRASDGVYRWHLGRAVPIRDRTGAISKWFGTWTDVHEQRMAAQERERELLRNQQRLALIAAAGSVLAESLDFRSTLEHIAHLGIPDIADWCQIDLVEPDGKIETVAVAHGDEHFNALLRPLLNLENFDRAASMGIPQVIKSGVAQSKSSMLIDAASSAVATEIYRGIGVNSAISIPLKIGQRIIGAITFVYSESGRLYADEDLDVAIQVADRAALAIENARLFEREHRSSMAFQNAALPKNLPRIHGIALSGFYQAAKAEALVGGDWYDAFRLYDGRLVVSIGDVMGSGLNAAVTMMAVRQAIRGAAQIYPDPVTVLDAADRALRVDQPDSMVTAFIGVLDPLTLVFTYASAGHPPAFLRDGDNRVLEISGSGLPLGIRTAHRSEHAHEMTITAPAMLVLYTDGLTEATRDMLEGERLLRAVLENDDILGSENPAASIAHAVVPVPHDDVAVLTVKIDVERLSFGNERAKNTTDMNWKFDVSDAGASRATRLAIGSILRIYGATEENVLTMELLYSELIGNVYRHSDGEVDVVIDTSGISAVLHILDHGPGFSFSARLPKDSFSESGRGLYIAAEMAWDLSVTPRVDGGSHTRVVLPFDLPKIAISANYLHEINETQAKLTSPG